MKTLTINLPDSIEVDNYDLSMIVASHLYEQGKLSLGQAADIAGFTKKPLPNY
jgi:predicted HTH domain antitoxin